MFCSNCGKKLEDSAAFCDGCGARIEGAKSDTAEYKTDILPDTAENPAGEEAAKDVQKMSQIFCPQCGTQNSGDFAYCLSCGAKLAGDGEGVGSGLKKNAGKKERRKKENKAGGKKQRIIGIVVVVLILLAAAGGIFAIRNVAGNEKNTYFYLKDNELWKGNVRNAKADAMLDDGIVSGGSSSFYPYSFNNYVEKTQDGKYLVYRISCEDSSSDLYSVELNKKNADRIKIGSDVRAYRVLKNNSVLYVNEEKALYLSDLAGNKEKIAKNVLNYRLTADEKTLIWLSTEEGKLYTQQLQKPGDNEKLDSDVDDLVFCSDDFKMIVYMKEQALYVLNNLQDKEKISENVDHAIVENADGICKILYMKNKTEGKQLSVWDFIDDDLAGSDAKIQEPKEEDYQETYEVQSFWGVEERTRTNDAYYEDRAVYQAKAQRDSWRENWKNTALDFADSFNNYDVCLYDTASGMSSDLLDDIWVSSYDKHYDAEYLACRCMRMEYFKAEDMERLKLSELPENVSYYDVQESIMNTLRLSEKVNAICVDGRIIDVDFEGRIVDNWKFDFSKDKVYLLLKEQDADGIASESGELVRLDYSDVNASKMEVMDTDVDRLRAVNGGKLYYLKDVDSGDSGELYCNGQKIDSDVYSYSVWVPEEGKLLYGVDYDDSSESVTQKYYDGEASVKIASDVYSAFYLDEKNILVLTDYNMEKRRGELKKYSGKELEKVASDVQWVWILD